MPSTAAIQLLHAVIEDHDFCHIITSRRGAGTFKFRNQGTNVEEERQHWISHRCKKQLYAIEDNEEEPEENESRCHVNEDLEISVNTISGMHGPRTTKLSATVRGRLIEVLVDTGSSHNFTNAILSDELKLSATIV
ncbi:ty3-gypsy retrotransposon protein [Striga asiatica]|uniref:Ty3-gypsy retrotransposon protein n=1 Tax=Striga asiatica TaxID=4170 RepID=A0A5A7PK15_STRAF|nr:ty3-gypsy retrotransposon protein [Striga asiatica]